MAILVAQNFYLLEWDTNQCDVQLSGHVFCTHLKLDPVSLWDCEQDIYGSEKMRRAASLFSYFWGHLANLEKKVILKES
jgi:hypothetical protein